MLILAAGAAAYANGATDHFVGFNAQRSLVDNPDIRSLWPLDQAMGLHLAGDAARADGGTLVRRPVLSLSFALGYAIHGPRAWAFQVVNIAVHLSAALLLFALVRRTLRAPRLARHWSQSGDFLATLVAMLWVVHPLTTESVTFVIQRAESLAALFALATVYCACRYFEDPSRRAWAASAVACCVFAFGTKESVVALPVIIWVYDALFFSGSLAAALRRRRGLLFALACAWLLPAVLVARTIADVQVDFRPGRTLDYLLAQPRVLAEYLRLAVWPDPLYLYSNTTRFTSPGTATILGFGAGVLLALAATAAAIRRGHPLAFLPAAFFLLLAPTSSFVATNDVIQEHRMYLPLAAVVCAAVLALFAAARRFTTNTRSARIGAGAVAATATIALASLTHARNLDYQSDFAAFYPGDLSMAHGALARHAAASGRFEEAAARLAAILELPREAFGTGPAERRYHRGRAHNDLGAVLVELGRLDAARAHVEAALATASPLPAAENNAAVLAALGGDPSGALERLQRIEPPREMRPWLAQNLGAAAALAGDDARAHRAFAETLSAHPEFELTRKSQEAMTTSEARIAHAHLFRNYDDAWLFLFLTPRPTRSE